MPTILIVIAVVLLSLWLIAHLVGALFHLLFWLFSLIPWIVGALVVAALVTHYLSKRA